VVVASGRGVWQVDEHRASSVCHLVHPFGMRWGEFDDLADGGLNIGRTGELLRSEIGVVDLM